MTQFLSKVVNQNIFDYPFYFELQTPIGIQADLLEEIQ